MTEHTNMVRYILTDKYDKMHNVDIELIDADYVHTWKETLTKTCAELNFGWELIIGGTWASGYDSGSSKFKDEIKLRKKQRLGEMITAYEHLIKVENGAQSTWHRAPDAFFADTLLVLEELYDDVGKLRQHHLNDWHRHFTTLEVRNQPLRLNIGDDDSRKHFFYIHEINRLVHKLEFLIPQPERKLKYPECYYSINFSNANNNGLIKMDECSKVWPYCKTLETGMFDIFTDDYDYDVWLHEDIVGKDHKKAWLEHDDLTQSDITGNYHLTPSIMLDINKVYKRVFDDEEFRKESKASGKTVDRLPLGNIVKPCGLVEMQGPITVQAILLDNDIIWENYEQ